MTGKIGKNALEADEEHLSKKKGATLKGKLDLDYSDEMRRDDEEIELEWVEKDEE